MFDHNGGIDTAEPSGFCFGNDRISWLGLSNNDIARLPFLSGKASVISLLAKGD